MTEYIVEFSMGNETPGLTIVGGWSTMDSFDIRNALIQDCIQKGIAPYKLKIKKFYPITNFFQKIYGEVFRFVLGW